MPRRDRPAGIAGQRVPAPLIRSRLPSGVGALLQPDVTGDGDARLTPLFSLMVLLTGLATGLLGDMTMFLLFSVEHLAFGVPCSAASSPLAALELTHTGFSLMVPMLIATVIATAVTRWIDGYSIYSARLSAPARVDV